MRSLLLVFFAALCVAANAQPMELVYRNDAPTYPSNYTASALMPDNKVVLTRSDTWRFYAGNLDAVCLDKFGNEAWTYPLGYGVASFALATTDNRIYIAVNDTNPRVIALDHSGGFVWRYDFTTGVRLAHFLR